MARGPFHPPRNSVVVNAQTVTILAYSAMKNIAYFMLEYSVQKPDTSSVSASGKSKGTRFISAKVQTKNTKAAKGCLKMYQSKPLKPDWRLTISFKERVWLSIKTDTMAKPAESS